MKHAQIKRIAMLLCLTGATLTSYADPDPNFHIYICWGQSNMEGNATVPNEEKQNVPERFQMLYTADDCSNGDRKKGQWYTAIPPLARCFHGSNKGYGPVDNFGRTLVAELDPEIRVGVVVVACGGTSIGLFERDYCEEFLRTAADWLQGYAREYGGNPYKRMIEMGKLAQESGVIKGILVHQGENDSGQESWPNRLKGVYETILEDLNLNASEVPLLVGEVRHDGQCSEHNKIIQKVPSVIPTAHVISSEGCEAERDIYHFSVKGYKELGKRYAEKMIELLGDNPVQLQDISLSAFTAKDNEPGEIAITINVENSEIQKVELYADNELLTDEITASASYTWENVSGGEHSIWAVGYDNSGKEYKTSTKKITIKEAQKPFNGTPAKIPGKIEAEEFDFGGEDNAYHDLDEQNRNGNTRNEGVDMSSTAVGYTQKGEWIEYTVEVEKSGEYMLESRVASGNNGAQFTLYMDNNFIIPGEDGTPGGVIDVPNTGDWETFTTVETELNRLEKGTHVLKVEITGDWVDLDYFNFVLVKADETEESDETGVEELIANKTYIPSGEYNVYDAAGRCLKVINYTRTGDNKLEKGFYILKNNAGDSYPLLVK